MRERLKDPGRLLHMLEMAQLLASERERQSLEAIKRDKVLFYGLTKMVEIIGEAAYKITKEFKQDNPQLAWREIEGMRHVLVHGYFSVSPEMLWDVIENDIPKLIPILQNFLQKDANC